jgi:SpoVK/Ycf46/Vps4 family AAA+-type ATPase
MGYFKLISKKKLSEITEKDKLEESDFSSLLSDGTFVQFEYVSEENKLPTYTVKPGVFAIVKTGSGFKLVETSFTKDKILEEFVNTENIVNIIDKFFNRLHVYTEEGIEVPKRAALLYGPAGTGKSTSISKIVDKYSSQEGTLIVVWHTDRLEPSEVKSFIKSFEYKDVKRMILIVEDIGGMENDRAQVRSDSSLLSLLDNKEKIFTLPIYIIATTNFPENLMANLTNRPDRFDDKIEVGFPSPEARKELLKFYLKNTWTQEAENQIISKKCEEFTPAHIREIRLRSRIHDKLPEEVIKDIYKEIETYKKAFTKQKNMAMGFHE